MTNKKIILKKSNVKDFIFYKYICEIYILADLKWNYEKPRFYRNIGRLLKMLK